MTAPQMPAPPGDPAGLDAAATALDRVAAGLGGHQQQLGSQAEGLRQVWQSDSAARAALVGAGTLRTAAGEYERSVRGGAEAVRGYAAALAEVQQAARGLQQRAAAIEQETRAALARSPGSAQQIIDQAEAAYRPLQAQHRQLLGNLDQYARRTRATLESLVPAYRPNMIGSAAANQPPARQPAVPLPSGAGLAESIGLLGRRAAAPPSTMVLPATEPSAPAMPAAMTVGPAEAVAVRTTDLRAPQLPGAMTVGPAEPVAVRTTDLRAPQLPGAMAVGSAEGVAIETTGLRAPQLPGAMTVGPAEAVAVRTTDLRAPQLPAGLVVPAATGTVTVRSEGLPVPEVPDAMVVRPADPVAAPVAAAGSVQIAGLIGVFGAHPPAPEIPEPPAESAVSELEQSWVSRSTPTR